MWRERVFVPILLTFWMGAGAWGQGLPEVRDWNSVSVKLERGSSGLGTDGFYSYSLEILGSGDVRYTGYGAVAITGEHRDRISRGEVEALLNRLRAERVWEQAEEPVFGVGRPMPSYLLTLRIDGVVKWVWDAPALAPVMEVVDGAGHGAQWVSGDGRTTDGLRREGFDFGSPEAGAMLVRAAARGNSLFLRELISAGAGKADAVVKMSALGEALRRGDVESERLLRGYGARGFPDVKEWSSVKITLDKSSCFGPCPAYTVEITGDGDVSYDGRYASNVRGPRKSTISKAAVRALVERFASADFFAVAGKRLGLPALDAHNITITITVDGVTAKATWFQAGQVPAPVMALEGEVDRVANTAQWVNAR